MKHRFCHLDPFAVASVLFALAAISTNAHESEVGVQVKLVCEDKLPNVPGQTLTAITVNYEPGGKSSQHQHAGSVFAYVLNGAIRSENSATGPAWVYQAGETFFEPPGSKHLVCENASTTEPASLLAVFVAPDQAQLTRWESEPSEHRNLPRELFETMLKVPGNQPGHRTVHAKGIVCTGAFIPAKAAPMLSKAVHFQGPSVPVVVRLSDGAPSPHVPDYSPEAGPRGLAVRFDLPNGGVTDLVLMSHNGFVVGTPEEFLELQKAIVSTDPSQPHPWPVEKFLGTHPRALKFVQDNRAVPVSFATEAFFSNDAFTFVNAQGVKQVGRYQLLPVAGTRHLSETEARIQTADFLGKDLRARLAGGAVEYRLLVQLPNPGDGTKDASVVWPADRKTIEVGTLRLTTVLEDRGNADVALAFDPTNLTDGLELSDDPLPTFRSSVYALAAKYRHQKAPAETADR
jgi:catalase